MTSIDPTEFVAKVRELAMANPEFVYQRQDNQGYKSCKYVHGVGTDHLTPGCLIGQALNALGVTTERLADFDTYPHGGTPARDLLASFDIFGDVAEWAGYVQARQDVKTPWGHAVHMANQDMGWETKS